MPDDTRPLVIPVNLDSFEELNRRVSIFSSQIDQRKADETAVLENFVYVAYGGMNLGTPIAGSDIGAAWQTIDFQVVTPATPKNVTIDVVADTFSFALEGIYAFSLSLSFEHNEAQQGRTTQLRIYNVTKAVEQAPPFVIGTGRNTTVTAYSVVTLAEILASEVGDLLRIEIGNGDTYSAVTWDSAALSVFSVGEFKGSL